MILIERLRELEKQPGWMPEAKEAREALEQAQAEIERLRTFLERGGIDSTAVLAGEDDGTWQDQNEKLQARNERLEAVREAAEGVAASWKYETRLTRAIEIVPLLDRLDEALAAAEDDDG